MAKSDKRSGDSRGKGGGGSANKPPAKEAPPAATGRHGGMVDDELDELFQEASSTAAPESSFPEESTDSGGAARSAPAMSAGAGSPGVEELELTRAIEPPPPIGMDDDEIMETGTYTPALSNGNGHAASTTIELAADEPEEFAEVGEPIEESAIEIAPPIAASDSHRPPPPPPPPRHHEDDSAALPPPPPTGERTTLTTLNDNGVFRKESQALARARDWQKLAAITSAAIDHASWVTLPETRAALLLDLARIHRDRLTDPLGAEQAFRRLAQVDPTNEDALQYLSKAYRDRGDWRAVYDLYSAAVEPTWDPNQRLEWTRETAEIATVRLRSTDLAIEAWERLERLGDAVEETYRALSEMYRRARRWDRLAQFLGKRAAQLPGTERVVALREVAEAYLSGLRDHEHAGEVLEQILGARPDDTIALLAYARVVARRGDWPALAALGERTMEGVPRAVVLDFRRVVADALFATGQRDEALEAYERVLELDPDDADALTAKERYLAEDSGRAAELVDFLVARSAREKSDEQKAELLTRAARLAEEQLDDARRASDLWERRGQLPVGQLATHQALERLYDRLGDLPGVARSLEGQLALTRNPSARVELLRRLGEHSAHRLGDDDRAEACWKEIISIVPDDKRTQDELLALHRRRGNFEALDEALAGRAFRTHDKEEVLGFWRAAARNIEENLRDPKRAVAAWNRVLDLSPEDEPALSARIGHHRTLGDRRDLVASLEAELRVTRDPAARRERALEVAQLWEEEGARVAALGAYERVLRWDPTDETALSALERLHTAKGVEGEVGSVIAALEVAAAVRGDRGDHAARIALLRRALSLADAGDKLGRFYALRRILWLSGRDAAVLSEVEAAAAEAGAWAELGEILRTLASEATDPTAREAHHEALARIYEKRLSDPVRAFLELQAGERRPVESAAALTELTRLADATSRYEDLLAILEAGAGAERPLDARRSVLRRRAELLEEKIKDPTRAFAERARLLQLDPHDEQALAEARRLAEHKGLWRALDALHAERGDRAATNDERVAIALERHAVRDAKLNDATGAVDQLLVAYRLDPLREGLGDRLLGQADKDDVWDRVLPLVEARARAAGDQAAPDELVRLGGLHEHQRDDLDRAFELYAEAFVLRPDAREVDEDIRRIAEADGRFAALATTYRLAAGHANTTERKLELLRRVAELATNRLHDDQAALDSHRRILQLDPASHASLERVIEHHRAKSEWRDLRDRLEQLVEQTADRSARVPRLLEIARISRDRLGDHEAALAAIEQVLEIDPTEAEAREAVRSLGGAGENPRFELRRLRIELPRAEAARRAEIQLACARIEHAQLDDTKAAIATLHALVKETGADGPGFEPLSALLRETHAWAELAELIEARAERLPDEAARVAALEQAVQVYEEHLPAAPLEKKEALSKRLLAERPDDTETRRRLLSLYRDAGQHDELAAGLRAALKAPGIEPEERRQFESELYRELALGLHKETEAAELLAARRPSDRTPDSESEALLARARAAQKKGDFAAWLEARQQHAKRLDPVHAALVLCHLAEACDDTPGQQLRTAGLYREARALDPHNVQAMEALKAIGRRAKSWRASASLLPEPDEAKLTHPERAAHLHAIAERSLAASPPDLARAADYLLRAVAVDPDRYAAWDALAELREKAGDHPAALYARAASLAAYQRSVAPAPNEIVAHVARIEALAAAARAAGETDRAAALSLQAHRLQPSYPAAALAVADRLLEDGDKPAALALYDRVLRGAATASRLDDKERLHATYRRGAISLGSARRDQATADLQAALKIDPLHAGVLRALAEALDDSGRVGAAATHYIQALLVEPEAHGRGSLYARLGRLLEDKLGSGEEAGVCYDLSIAATPSGDVGDREVLARALAYYRRQDRPERALAVIERILPTIEDPREQAALWTERGSILGAAGDEDRAMEAFDMALSYDPGSRGAITGLSRILEKRGDWEQLAQIFEARTETGSPEERAEALRALARMATSHLKDSARAERYLRSVVELAPTREDFEQLLAIYGDDPAHQEGRMQVLSGLLGLGGPYMPRVIEFGKHLVAQGDRRWAWCVLSPLMNSTLSEPQLKATVLELRKEFEKSDNTGVLTPTTHQSVAPHSALSPAVLEVLAELDAAVTLGRSTLDAAGAGGTGKLDERTAVGKNFAAVAARLGLEGTQLTRAQDLPEPYVILDGEKGHVVVRAELLQLLSVAETAFLFATLIELSRPGVRLLASLRDGERALLLPSLLAACGRGEIPAGGAQLVEQIVAGTTEEQRADWAARLPEIESAEAAGSQLFHAQLEVARRVGLIAAADLRFAARVITRLDETLPKMQTVGRIDDLDDFIAGTPPVRALLGFAVTPLFGQLLHGN